MSRLAWTSVVVFLCGFAAIAWPPSGVCDAQLYSRSSYERLTLYQVPNYSKYRSTRSNFLKRYTRHYSYSRLGEAATYQPLYSRVARMYGWRASTYTYYSRDCDNYETNTYGDFMGAFSCPLFFEPSNFSHCCGVDSHHYCCSKDPKGSSTKTTLPFSIGIIVAIAFVGLCVVGTIIGFVIFLCVVCCAESNKRPRRTAVAPTVATQPWTTGIHYNNAPPQQAAYPQQTAYPQQMAYPPQTYHPVPPPYQQQLPSYYNNPAYPPPAYPPTT